MLELTKGGYCYRVHSYDHYLYDAGELRAMGYRVDDRWNAFVIKANGGFKGLYLHVDSEGVSVHDHTEFAERVPNLEFIINELPVLS